MNFGVIGEPCIDFIHKEGLEPVKRLGGILYSINALSVISGREHDIFPIMNLGEDEFNNITGFLQKFNNIKHDYINKVNQKTRVVQLYYGINRSNYVYHEPKEIKPSEKPKEQIGTYVNYDMNYTDRNETSTKPALPIEFGNIKKTLPNMDALMINMVSGIDITLDTLIKVRQEFGGYIHLDIHNIVMKHSPDGQREHVSVENWMDWCTNSDTIQFNESEMRVISPEKLNEYDLALKILNSSPNGPKAIAVTRGKSGVSLLMKKENKVLGENYTDLDRTDMPAIENSRFNDSTGCGDTFGAGFFYINAVNRQKDYNAALNYGNKLASAKTEFIGVEEMEKLKK